MKHKPLWRIILLSSCFLFSQNVAAEGASSKSLWLSLAVPVIAGVYTWSQHDLEGGKELIYASMFTVHTTTLIKNSVRRTRPNGGDDLSFPSGHAAAAFMGASYAQHRYGWNLGLPMYGLAAGVAAHRFNTKKHYWTDIIAGAGLGWLSGYLFTAKYPNIWLEADFDPEKKSYTINMKARF